MNKEDRQIVADIQYEIAKTCVNYADGKDDIKPKHYIRALSQLLYEETPKLFK